MGWSPQELTTRHEEIIRRHIAGQSHTKIAHDLDLTPVAVSLILRSDLAKERIADLSQRITNKFIDNTSDPLDKAKEILIGAAADAATTTVNMLKSVDDKVRLRAANDILDRVGVTRKGEFANTGTKVIMNVDQTTNILMAMKESGADVSAFIEHEPANSLDAEQEEDRLPAGAIKAESILSR